MRCCAGAIRSLPRISRPTAYPSTPTRWRPLQTGWQGIQHSLIAAVDADFGVYDGTTFKQDRFEKLLIRQGIAWPRLATGTLDLQDDTFKDMARMHPQLAPLRELRGALSQMRLSDLHVGDDGRNRCLLSMYGSKTGRNQPSNTNSSSAPRSGCAV